MITHPHPNFSGGLTVYVDVINYLSIPCIESQDHDRRYPGIYRQPQQFCCGSALKGGTAYVWIQSLAGDQSQHSFVGAFDDCFTAHYYRQTSNKRGAKYQNFNVSRLVLQVFFPIHWSQMLTWEWRCSWSSSDSRSSNYILVINRFMAYNGATYTRGLAVQWLHMGVMPPQITGKSTIQYLGQAIS